MPWWIIELYASFYLGYKMRPVQEAKNYDVVSFARAMNDDFGGRVQKLFEPEKEAALEAQETGRFAAFKKFWVIHTQFHELYFLFSCRATESDNKWKFEFVLRLYDERLKPDLHQVTAIATSGTGGRNTFQW